MCEQKKAICYHSFSYHFIYTGIWLDEQKPLDKDLQQILLASARKGA